MTIEATQNKMNKAITNWAIKEGAPREEQRVAAVAANTAIREWCKARRDASATRPDLPVAILQNDAKVYLDRPGYAGIGFTTGRIFSEYDGVKIEPSILNGGAYITAHVRAPEMYDAYLCEGDRVAVDGITYIVRIYRDPHCSTQANLEKIEGNPTAVIEGITEHMAELSEEEIAEFIEKDIDARFVAITVESKLGLVNSVTNEVLAHARTFGFK